MKRTIGTILASAAFCLAVGVFAPASVWAQTNDEYVIHDFDAPAKPTPVKHKPVRHHKKRAKTKRRHTQKTSNSNAHAHIRAAQGYLERLGYDPGPDDGLLGRKTKAALRQFQRDHDLSATGVLTDATFRALSKETIGKSQAGDLPQPPRPDFLSTHPDFYGYYGTQGLNPNTLVSPQPIPSRFGTALIDEQQIGSTYNYTVTLNGQPVFHADRQPSFVNVSRTFNLDDTDAVLLTSYASGDSVCPYRHALLIMRTTGSGVRDIANCTRDYDAYTENGMLLISFPGSHADGLSSGDSWRYDHGVLEKL